VLEVAGVDLDHALLGAWRARVERAGARLNWVTRDSAVRRHASGASLAIAAPCDQLFVATEINEWALCAALIERDPVKWSGVEESLVVAARAAAEDSANPEAALMPVIEESAALARFERLAAEETRSAMRALLDSAASRGLPHILDESELTLGSGSGGRTYTLAALPAVTEVPWGELHGIPTALVTGSNGKTTTVRLLAACARAGGRHVGYNCTDGVFVDDDTLAAGDYSGPAGARQVMRDRRVEAAILETARGGILRRGIAVSHADVAIVTNISSDHFGEYGIHDLAGLADVKLTVAAAVTLSGMLVLNADDPQLRARANELQQRFGRCPPLGWFAQDADQAALQEYRSRGAATCGMRAGRLLVIHGGSEHDLGLVSAMPWLPPRLEFQRRRSPRCSPGLATARMTIRAA